ncbi:MAG: sulfatase-like hydrolase/transferase [Deltaproteobacteria bacterium]|nr:sulfatase-like hydrolase/transferase [Deltaproteobacteria bacterium]MBW2362351.1 sulfatase-like hydrolase/transferase [Deltaproteobacteria bacterium]
MLWVAACGSPQSDGAAVAERPNIVLIISDDHGYGDFGFMGSEVAKTPNIDRLAREGSTFPVTYNTGSLCRPSLISLLTGLDPKQWEVSTAEFARSGPRSRGKQAIRHFATLPRVLGKHGYATFQAGKLWEGNYEMAGFGDGLKTRHATGLRDTGAWAGGDESLAVGRTTLAPVTDFIDAHVGEPFFVWFAPMLPHTPHDAPKHYEDRYADLGLSGRERRYFANVSRLDDAVGALIAHLERRGLRERTLVVFLADNGWEPERRDDEQVWVGGAKGKASMFELGWRTPLVFNWPNAIPAGEVKPSLVSTLDLFPTLLDYAGAAPLPDRPGRSLRPVLDGGDPDIRTALYGSDRGIRPRERAQHGPPSAPRAPAFFARSARWHYIWTSETGDDALYDILEDPDEEENVATAHPEQVQRFRTEIEAWHEAVQEPLLPPAP